MSLKLKTLKKAKEVLEGKKINRIWERERDCGIWGRRGGDHISRRKRDAQQSSPSVSAVVVVELWRSLKDKNKKKKRPQELLLFLCNSPEVLPFLFDLLVGSITTGY